MRTVQPSDMTLNKTEREESTVTTGGEVRGVTPASTLGRHPPGLVGASPYTARWGSTAPPVPRKTIKDILGGPG